MGLVVVWQPQLGLLSLAQGVLVLLRAQPQLAAGQQHSRPLLVKRKLGQEQLVAQQRMAVQERKAEGWRVVGGCRIQGLAQRTRTMQ